MRRLIDADALKEVFKGVYPLATNEMGCIVNKRIYDIIDNAPTIDSLDLDVHIGGRCCGKRQKLLDELRPKGEWIDVIPTYPYPFKCSVCGHMNSHKPRYCSNCGSLNNKDIEEWRGDA